MQPLYPDSDRGDSYFCAWDQTQAGVRMWLADRPNVFVTAQSLESAKDKMALLIMHKYGDASPTINLTPYPRISLLSACFYALGFNVTVLVKNKAEIFGDGFCDICGYARGSRSAMRAKIEDAPPYDVFGIEGFLPGAVAYSEKLLAQLGDRVKPFCFLPVDVLHSRSRRRFYELTAQSAVMPVGVKGASYYFPPSWICKSCGNRRFITRLPGQGLEMRTFVAACDVGSRECFAVLDLVSGPLLCVSENLCSEFIGRGFRGLATMPIGVVGDDVVDRNPSLPEIESREDIEKLLQDGLKAIEGDTPTPPLA